MDEEYVASVLERTCNTALCQSKKKKQNMEYKTTTLKHTRFNITEQTTNLSFNDIYYMTSSVSERDENLAGAHMRQLLRLSNS